MTFVKQFPSATPLDGIRQEAEFQTRAAEIGLSPPVLSYSPTSIVMGKVDALCIADEYGASIEDIPVWIREEIVNILHTLYVTLEIEYIDVTPYNFIEKDGKVWIIDFGHAKKTSEQVHYYLEEVFETWTLEKWNSDFA